MNEVFEIEGRTLEAILSNVRTNNPGRNTASIERDVRANFLAYCQARAGRNVRQIAEEFGLPHGRVNSWRYFGTSPLALKPYFNSFEPDTEEEKIAFAYLLGALSRSYGSRSTVRFERTFHDDSAMARFSASLETMLGKKAISVGKRRVGTHNRQFVHFASYHLTHSFDRYVPTGEHRLSFLRGFFDASKISVVDSGSNRGYFITCLDIATVDRVVRTLFELGVYATINPTGTDFSIQGHDELYTFQEIGIDQNQGNRKKVKAILGDEGLRDTIKKYYDVRRKAADLKMKGKTPSRKELGKKHDVEETVVGTWIADIIEKKYTCRVPNPVRRYETLLSRFGVPNRFTQEKSVPPPELPPVATAAPPSLPEIVINIEGVRYQFSPGAATKYYALGEMKPYRLDAEEEGWLAQQLRAQLRGATGIFRFTLNDGVVTDIGHNQKFAKNGTPRRDYEGIRQDDGPALTDRFSN